MFKFLQNRRWETSEAHLLFLTNFLKGVDTRYSEKKLSFWRDALDEPTEVAIKRWLKQGVIVKSQPNVTLERMYNAKELKSFCKDHSLPVTGTKAVLIKRLLECNSNKIQLIVLNSQVYSCSSEFADIANAYLLKAKQDKLDTERLSYQYLLKNNLTEAANTMVQYEQRQVFPRGIGVKWDKHEIAQDVEELELILHKTPGILADMSIEDIDSIRVPAGMTRLFGTNTAKKWLPGEVTTGIHLSPDEACRMLVFYARNIVKINQAMKFGATHLQFNCGSQNLCEACKRIDGNSFPINLAPEIPLKNCKCVHGCSVITNPIFDR